jgi:hypothetical protein
VWHISTETGNLVKVLQSYINFDIIGSVDAKKGALLTIL